MPFVTRPNRDRWDRDREYMRTVPSSAPSADPAPAVAGRSHMTCPTGYPPAQAAGR
jgi:hypothetical protein